MVNEGKLSLPQLALHCDSCTEIILFPLLSAPQKRGIASINHLIYFMLTGWDVMTFKHIDVFFSATCHILLSDIIILVSSYVQLGQCQVLCVCFPHITLSTPPTTYEVTPTTRR